MLRRHLLTAAGLGICLPAARAAESSDAWPQRPVRFIVPAGPGGTNDVLGRFLQDPLSKALGQPVIVDYRAGAGGAIGSVYVANQAADGYTFLLHGSGLVTVPLVQRKPSYDALKDFMPVTMIGTSPMILMTHPSMPPTLAGFVQYAKAHPGELEWGSSALGGVGQLAMEAFHEAAGIQKMLMVPYPGAGPAGQALLTGQTKYMLSTPSSATASFLKDGKIRVLGVSTAQRSALLPEIPTIGEVVPGYHADTWFGLLARAGTPAPVIAKIGDAVARIVAQPDIQEKMRAVYVMPQTGRAELDAVMRSDHALWGRVVKANNIVID